MDSKEFGLVAAQQLFKIEDIHYGFWKDGENATLSNWKQAQEAHTEFLFKHIFKHIEDKEKSYMLDIGCGVGWYLSILENIGVSKYIGIDPDVKSIEYAKIMTKNVNLDAKVSVNSVENINCKADTILMLSVNHRLDNQLSVFEKFDCQNIILDSWEFRKDINLNDILNHFRTLNFQCIQKKLFDYEGGGINGYRYILHLEKKP